MAGVVQLLPSARMRRRMLVSRCCVGYRRAAFAMGILASMKSDLDLAEALHLEAVLVLDRLPEV